MIAGTQSSGSFRSNRSEPLLTSHLWGFLCFSRSRFEESSSSAIAQISSFAPLTSGSSRETSGGGTKALAGRPETSSGYTKPVAERGCSRCSRKNIFLPFDISRPFNFPMASKGSSAAHPQACRSSSNRRRSTSGPKSSIRRDLFVPVFVFTIGCPSRSALFKCLCWLHWALAKDPKDQQPLLPNS